MKNNLENFVQAKIFDRYINLIEVRRKAKDLSIELIKERDKLAQIIKELSEILGNSQAEVTGLKLEHEKLVLRIAELERIQKQDKLEHEKLILYIAELESIQKQDKLEHEKLVLHIGNIENKRVELENRLKQALEERDYYLGALDSIQSKWIYKQYQKIKKLFKK